jgi:RIO kinase 1
MDIRDSQDPWFDEYRAEGLLSEVLGALRSGKEASVHLCRATPWRGGGLVAAKVYKPRESRSFRNDAAYLDGRVILRHRDRRAVERRSRWGRFVGHHLWVDREYEVLTALAAAGADVPRPIACRGTTILMEFVGDGESPAPQLCSVRPTTAEARVLLDRIVRNVELMLSVHVVHADLSPYNVLVHDGRPVFIDFPQAVDARTNRHARELLGRDLENVCRYLARRGAPADARSLASRMWERYVNATT